MKTLKDKINKIYNCDCLEGLKQLEDNSVDSIVTDPPYELGFMGKSWDKTGIANNKEMWAECLRVLKPGGHLLAFSGTRTYHRMAVAIEDAGFEVRDMIEWVYGSGFPKSLNIAKMLDKMEGVEHPKNTLISDNGSMSGGNYTRNKMDVQSDLAKEWEGWGTALKPAHEPICMARKPLAEKTLAENCLKYGTGGINIDESRVICDLEKEDLSRGRQSNGGAIFGSTSKEIKIEPNNLGRFPANLIHDNSEEVRECFPEQKSGARSSKHEIGNEDGEMFNHGIYGKYKAKNYDDSPAESGNASRFFKSIIYQAKASKSERNKGLEDFEEVEVRGGGGRVEDGYDLSDPQQIRLKEAARKYGAVKAKKTNIHPTVKPIALMEYLIKMVTPNGGIVLDPFMGSGSTGVACKQNGFSFIGIEMEEEYYKIAEARINRVNNQNIKEK